MSHSAKRAAAYLALAIATAIAVGAAGLSIANKSDVTKIERKIIRIGDPCVDENGNKPGVVPSEGCRKYRRLLDQVCADDPGFCRKSQQDAIKMAQLTAAPFVRAKDKKETHESNRRNQSQADVGNRTEGNGGSGRDQINNPPGQEDQPNQQSPPNTNNPGGGDGNQGNNPGGGQGNNNGGGQGNNPPVQVNPPRIKVDPPPIVIPPFPPVDVPPVCIDLDLLKPGLQC